MFAPRKEQRLWLFQYARTLDYLGGVLKLIKARPGTQIIYDPQRARLCSGRRVQSVKILNTDDHKIMRDGLRHLLGDEAGIEVVAEAERP